MRPTWRGGRTRPDESCPAAGIALAVVLVARRLHRVAEQTPAPRTSASTALLLLLQLRTQRRWRHCWDPGAPARRPAPWSRAADACSEPRWIGRTRRVNRVRLPHRGPRPCGTACGRRGMRLASRARGLERWNTQQLRTCPQIPGRSVTEEDPWRALGSEHWVSYPGCFQCPGDHQTAQDSEQSLTDPTSRRTPPHPRVAFESGQARPLAPVPNPAPTPWSPVSGTTRSLEARVLIQMLRHRLARLARPTFG